MEFSSVHYFSDDTNLLLSHHSLEKLNQHINRDLLADEWLRANKLFLSSSKTELVIFKSKNKNITKNLNF